MLQFYGQEHINGNTVFFRGYVTTFTVEPRADGQHAHVTIATEITGRGGVLEALERWFVTRFLHPVYVKELEQLATVAGAQVVT